MRDACLRSCGPFVVCLLVAGCGGSASPTAPTSTYPNVQGSWHGDWEATGCNDESTPGFCEGTVGSSAPMTLTLVQANDQLSGVFESGRIAIPVSGSVSPSGRILLSGSTALTVPLPFPDVHVVALVTIVNWDTRAAGSIMSGGWTLAFRLSGDFSGEASIDATIRLLTRD